MCVWVARNPGAEAVSAHLEVPLVALEEDLNEPALEYS